MFLALFFSNKWNNIVQIHVTVSFYFYYYQKNHECQQSSISLSGMKNVIFKVSEMRETWILRDFFKSSSLFKFLVKRKTVNFQHVQPTLIATVYYLSESTTYMHVCVYIFDKNAKILTSVSFTIQQMAFIAIKKRTCSFK
jgi:hypothetical protein